MRLPGERARDRFAALAGATLPGFASRVLLGQRGRQQKIVAALLGVLLVATSAFPPPVAAFSTFTVTSNLDASDSAPGDGTCATAAGTCTIRAAFEEANALGDVTEVLVPAESYLIAAPIEVSTDITLLGEGQAQTLLAPLTSGFGAIFMVGQGASLSMHDFAFSGNGPALTETAGSNASVGIYDAAMSDSDWTAFYAAENMSDGASLQVERTTFTNVDYPIFFDQGVDQSLDVRDSSFVRSGYSALFADTHSGQFTIADSEIVNTSTYTGSHNGIEFYATKTQPGEGDTQLELVRTRVSGSSGEGIYAQGSNSLAAPNLTTRLIDSSVVDNGGVGMFVGGNLEARDSTISGNSLIGLQQELGSATLSGMTISGNNRYGVELDYSDADIVNTTISGNASGIGIWNSTALVRNVAVTGSYGSGLYNGDGFESYGGVTLENSVVADNVVDCAAEFVSGGNNADSDGSCALSGPGDMSAIDPLLGPLADNGGPTLTRLPQPGSPLIDAGSNANCPTADQRGFARPVDGDADGTATCDIGPVEAGSGGTPPSQIQVQWSAEAARRNLLPADGTIDVTVTADPGGTGFADFDVMSWYPDGDPSQALLGAPGPATIRVALAELTPGVYSGALSLNGVAQVDSITGLVQLAGQEDLSETTSDRLPVFVAGALEVNSQLDVEPWELPNARLVASSETERDGATLPVPVSGTVVTRWLQPGDDYLLSVTDAQNNVVATLSDPQSVRGGLITPVDLILTPTPLIPFSAQVVDANGAPVEGVKVTITDDASGDQIAKSTTSADGTVSAVASSPSVTIAVDPLDLPYAPLERQLTLTALDQTVEVTVGATLPTATVSGIVDHPDRPPVAGARVSLETQVGDRFFTTSVIAGEGGLYSAEVFQGLVTVRVDEPRAGKAEETVEVTGDTTVNLMLDGPAIGTVQIELLTRLAGESTSTAVQLNGPNVWHYNLWIENLSTHQSLRPSGELTDVAVRVGDVFRVCADGHEAHLPKACVDAPVDPDTLVASATLELVQSGQVQGFLAATFPDGICDLCDYRADLSASLVKVAPDGEVLIDRQSLKTEEPIVKGEPFSAPFVFGVFEPGTYEIQLSVAHYTKRPDPCGGYAGCPPPPGWEWVAGDSAVVRIDVPQDAVLDLGDVPVSRCYLLASNCLGSFGTSPLSQATVSPSEILPGGIARLRASADNAGDGYTPATTIENARLRLEIPAGTTLVPGSVTLDGESTAFTLDGSVLEVAVGTMQPDEQRTLGAWVKVDPAADIDAIFTRGTIVYGADDATELLGSGAAVVRRVTLLAESQTSKLELPVSGRALPNASVEITVDGLTAATVTASPGGTWSATVSLPSTRLPRDFVLQAIVHSADGTFSSDPRGIWYDPTTPMLVGASLYQPGGSSMQLVPGPVARFPFVYVPPKSIIVDLEFDHPTRVTDAWVAIGDHFAPASFDPSTGTWTAVFNLGRNPLGKVAVGYNRTVTKIDLTSGQQAPLTEDELRAYLPPPFSTYTNLQQETDPGSGDWVVSATLPELDNANVQLSIGTTAGSYAPTADDLALQDAIGAPLWDFNTTITPGPDDSGEIQYSFFIPQSALAASTTASAPTTANASAPTILLARATPPRLQPKAISQVGEAVGTYVIEDLFFEHEFEAAKTGWELGGALEADAFLDKLNQVLDRVDATCDPTYADVHRRQLDDLAWEYMGSKGLSAALMFAGVFLTPETLGLSIGLFALTEAINIAAEKRLDHRLEVIQESVSETCGPEQETDPQNSGQTEPCDRNVWFDACDVLADPTWIYDPSGFVYEVFQDNRLAGVTATLETAPTPDGPWSIWDADWYLQQNPLQTNQQGNYGWDVPEGWWRVRFEKDGYATEYSDVLQVLPPHLDINVGMRRLTGPAIADATGYAGESSIGLSFDSWMLPAWLTPEAFQVTDANLQDVPVSVSLGDVRSSPEYGDLVRTVQLDLGRPLVEGETFTVTVNSSAQTYAGVAADADLAAEVTVAGEPPIEPVNTPPTISDVANQTIDEDGSTGPLAVTVGDAETVPADLVLSVVSSSPGRVPPEGIVLGGSGANRTLTITPAANQNGLVVMTLTVSDGDGGVATTSFELYITPVNDPPTISDVIDQTIDQDSSTGELSVTVGDIETSPAALVLSASSSNTALVPDANIVLGGFGADRTVSVTPLAGAFGLTTITLTVTDGGGATAVDTFTVTVTPASAAPLIELTAGTASADYSDPVPSIGVTVSDAGASPSELSVWVEGLPANVTMGPVSMPDGDIVGGHLIADISGYAMAAPGTYSATVHASDGSLTSSEPFEVTITPESASATFTGQSLVFTPSRTSGAVTVLLQATIKDITAVSPNDDPDPGDISNATVAFVDRATGELLCSVSGVVPVDEADPTVGIAACEWDARMNGRDPEAVSVGMVVGGYYAQDDPTADGQVTIARPVPSRVIGGGRLFASAPAGLAAADGVTVEFGLGLRYNKAATRITNKPRLMLSAGGRRYKLRTTSVQSLTIDAASGTATIVARATLIDVTGDTPIVVARGLHLRLDAGDAAAGDSLAVTLLDGSQLLLALTWDGTSSVATPLSSGSIRIR